MSEKIEKSRDEWQQQLEPMSFCVARDCGTEPPFRNAYWDNKEPGAYNCICCGAALFSSETKYDSGTGWPSFFAPVDAGNLAELIDNSHGKVRTEVRCAQCDAHLGHVFPDGPQPTGLRYCMNSASMSFEPQG